MRYSICLVRHIYDIMIWNVRGRVVTNQHFYYIVELTHDSDGSLVACGRPAGGKGGRRIKSAREKKKSPEEKGMGGGG